MIQRSRWNLKTIELAPHGEPIRLEVAAVLRKQGKLVGIKAQKSSSDRLLKSFTHFFFFFFNAKLIIFYYYLNKKSTTKQKFVAFFI